MKNILILHHVSSLGGGTKSLIDLAIMLKKSNSVKICIPKGSIEIIEIALKHKIEYYEVETPIPSFNFYSGMPGFFSKYTISRLLRFRNNKKLVQELLLLDPDVVFYNTVVTSLIAKDMPKNIVNICIVRETFIKSKINEIYKNNFEKNFSGVAFIAENEMKYLSLKNPKQIVIPDCLEPSDICFLDQKQLKEKYDVINKFCIIFMGGTIQIKGLDVALRAVNRLSNEYCLLIVGVINNKSLEYSHIIKHLYNIKYAYFLLVIKKLLKKLSKQNKVKVLGYYKDISEPMNVCDTVIFPSTSAHQPRPCIEAGEYKKSVILSDYDETKEYFIDGFNAITFKPKDHNILATKIRYLKENKDINKMLSENNFHMTKTKHDYGETQKRLNLFIENVINRQ